MLISTVSSKGQIVIPKELREKFGIKRGSRLTWIEAGSALILVPLPDDPISGSRGMLKGKKISTEKLLEARREERELEEQIRPGLIRPHRVPER